MGLSKYTPTSSSTTSSTSSSPASSPTTSPTTSPALRALGTSKKALMSSLKLNKIFGDSACSGGGGSGSGGSGGGGGGGSGIGAKRKTPSTTPIHSGYTSPISTSPPSSATSPAVSPRENGGLQLSPRSNANSGGPAMVSPRTSANVIKLNKLLGSQTTDRDQGILDATLNHSLAPPSTLPNSTSTEHLDHHARAGTTYTRPTSTTASAAGSLSPRFARSSTSVEPSKVTGFPGVRTHKAVKEKYTILPLPPSLERDVDARKIPGSSIDEENADIFDFAARKSGHHSSPSSPKLEKKSSKLDSLLGPRLSRKEEKKLSKAARKSTTVLVRGSIGGGGGGGGGDADRIECVEGEAVSKDGVQRHRSAEQAARTRTSIRGGRGNDGVIMRRACQTGDLEGVVKLLDTHAFHRGTEKAAGEFSVVESPDNERWRPIHHAAVNMYFAICVELIEAGQANIHAVTGSRDTPLHLLASTDVRSSGDEMAEKVFSLLLPDNVYAHNSQGNTPLHTAAEHGRTPWVELLLKNYSAVNLQNSVAEETPLHLACRNGHVQAVRLLLERGADVSIVGHSGLARDLAREARHFEVLNLLSRYDDGPTGDEMRGRFRSRVSSIALLDGQEGVDGVEEGQEANEFEDNDVLGELRKCSFIAGGGSRLSHSEGGGAGGGPHHTTPPHSRGGSFARANSRPGSMDGRGGFVPNPNYQMIKVVLPALWVALRGGNTVEVRRLLRESGDGQRLLSVPESATGLLPLHVAVEADNAKLVEALLEYGASPDARACPPCRTLHVALHTAALQGSLTLVQRLIKAKATVDVRCAETAPYWGASPLRLSCLPNKKVPAVTSLAIARKLLEAGADVAAVSGAGRWGTLLHHAINEYNKEVVFLLCEFGAKIGSQTVDGRTEMELAEPHPDLTHMLVIEDKIDWARERSMIKLSFAVPTLGLASQEMTRLPSSIRSMDMLHVLDLNDNKLSTLPPALSALQSLKTLNLSNNHFYCVPGPVCTLSSLEELNLDNNRLTVLPAGMGDLKNLTSLRLTRNKELFTLPVSLSKLSKLSTLELDPPDRDHKWLQPPNVFVEQGVDTILRYLGDKSARSGPYYNVKLMFVGQENVGKTSLLRCLTSTKGKKTKKEALQTISTDGIDIEQWDMDLEKEKDKSKGAGKKKGKDKMGGGGAAGIQDAANRIGYGNAVPGKLSFSCWDFAGQEIYYPTHSFFISERAIYLLVWNLEHGADSGRVEYWLRTINGRAPNAKVILVGTHLDTVGERQAEAATDELLSRYKLRQLVTKFFFVSCSASMKGIEPLKKYLKESGTRLAENPLNHIPGSYSDLEEFLQCQRDQLLKTFKSPIMQWSVLCATAPSFDEALLKRAAAMLHDLGSIVYFDDHTHGLDELVVLEPQWLTRVFASIITTKHRFCKRGLLPHTDLTQQIWRIYPSNIHQQLLSLLQHFDIIYPLKLTRAQIERLGVPVPPVISGGDDSSAPTDNGSADVEEEPTYLHYLLPSLLPINKPSGVRSEWPAFCGDGHKQLARVYQFNFLPLGFFARLIVRVLNLGKGLVPLYFWAGGILMRRGEEIALLKYHQNMFRLSVDVRISENGRSHLLREVVECVDTLVQGWYDSKVEIIIPCCHCLSGRSTYAEPFLFKISTCADAITQGKAVVLCRNETPIIIEYLAPDLAFANFDRAIISFKKIKIMSTLGKGSFGVVFAGLWEGQEVAVKVMKSVAAAESNKQIIADQKRQGPMIPGESPRGDSDDIGQENMAMLEQSIGLGGAANASNILDSDFMEFQREAVLMSSMKHPAVVELRGICLNPLAMVMECLAMGTLYHALANPVHDFPWKVVVTLASDIASGMQYLHNVTPPIIHRDLRSPNILLHSLKPPQSLNTVLEALHVAASSSLQNNDGKKKKLSITQALSDGVGLCGKVADFGLSRLLHGGSLAGGDFNINWLAPEAILGKEYTEKVDVYSFGMVLWELLTRSTPFSEYDGKWRNHFEVREKIVGGLRPTIPDNAPPKFASLIRQCWEGDASKRPSFDDIIEHLMDIITSYGDEPTGWVQATPVR